MSKRTTGKDPLQTAIESAEADFWTLRPPPDVRRMIARAIKTDGRNKQFWVFECIRAALATGKKDLHPVVLKAGRL